MPPSTGRPHLAIPGPSVMPDRVLAAMQRPTPNIYAGPLVEMVDGMLPDLRRVARTRHEVAIYIANGHGMWEAALTNLFSAGDRVLVLATGRFGLGWADVARRLGLDVEVVDFGLTRPVDPARLAERLRRDGEHAIRAVLAVHVDTATTVRNDIAAIRRAIDDAAHPALLAADCIASLGCDVFEMDAWGVDVMIAASQKGLMTPPGLGFAFFGPKAAAARARAGLVTPYWDWAPRARPDVFYQFFGGTAPTHHLFALREALTMLVHEEGVEAAWARHARHARTIWAAVEAWQAAGAMAPNVIERAARAHSVTCLSMPPPNATSLRDWLAGHAEVTLGIGLGMAEADDPAWHGWFRIGHMGHLNAHMVMGTLGAIEAGLAALDLPHDHGALEAAAREIAAG